MPFGVAQVEGACAPGMGTTGRRLAARVLEFRPQRIGICHLEGEGDARAAAAFEGGAARVGNA